MKTFIIALALVASAYAYSIDDIPDFMRDRLDRYVALKQRWAEKWSKMTEQEQQHYEQALLDRLDHLPEIELNRMHDRIVAMPEEHRVNMLEFLRMRFPSDSDKTFDDEVEAIFDIVLKMPELLRNKINAAISVRFQEATAYGMDDVSGQTNAVTNL